MRGLIIFMLLGVVSESSSINWPVSLPTKETVQTYAPWGLAATAGGLGYAAYNWREKVNPWLVGGGGLAGGLAGAGIGRQIGYNPYVAAAMGLILGGALGKYGYLGYQGYQKTESDVKEDSSASEKTVFGVVIDSEKWKKISKEKEKERNAEEAKNKEDAVQKAKREKEKRDREERAQVGRNWPEKSSFAAIVNEYTKNKMLQLIESQETVPPGQQPSFAYKDLQEAFRNYGDKNNKNEEIIFQYLVDKELLTQKPNTDNYTLDSHYYKVPPNLLYFYFNDSNIRTKWLKLTEQMGEQNKKEASATLLSQQFKDKSIVVSVVSKASAEK